MTIDDTGRIDLFADDAEDDTPPAAGVVAVCGECGGKGLRKCHGCPNDLPGTCKVCPVTDCPPCPACGGKGTQEVKP